VAHIHGFSFHSLTRARCSGLYVIAELWSDFKRNLRALVACIQAVRFLNAWHDRDWKTMRMLCASADQPSFFGVAFFRWVCLFVRPLSSVRVRR
jgi:hypothetical protein